MSLRAADHLGASDRSIRTDLTAWLATRGSRRRGRSATCFNPLTVYWCQDEAGAPLCVVAEVHNTYGERHCYLLRPDER